MNKFYCGVCGQLLNDEKKIVSGTGVAMCRECYYDAFLSDGSEAENSLANLRTLSESKVGNIWTKYIKTMCYIAWALITVMGAVSGKETFSLFHASEGIGILLGGLLGFIIGFVSIAVIMAFVRLCEDVSAMRKNSDKILRKLDDKEK